jgi:hypothetical protein
MNENRTQHIITEEKKLTEEQIAPESATPVYPVPATNHATNYIPVRRGISSTTVIALLLGVVTLGLVAFYFITQKNEEEHQQELQQAQAREAAANNKPAPPPIIVQQPAQQQPQQPVVVQQPAAQPPVVIERSAPPVVINQPATTAPTVKKPDDTSIQNEIDTKLMKEPALSSLGITASVTEGKVILIGSVSTPELKRRIERVVKAVDGVRSVDNQIVVFNG